VWEGVGGCPGFSLNHLPFLPGEEKASAREWGEDRVQEEAGYIWVLFWQAVRVQSSFCFSSYNTIFDDR
jgi:hypothetical protein